VSPLKIEMQAICLTSEGEAWHEGKSGYTGFIHVWSEAPKEAKIEGVAIRKLEAYQVREEKPAEPVAEPVAACGITHCP
jgi:hypothetical protein